MHGGSAQIPLGDCSDFALIDALTPTKKGGLREPSDSGPVRSALRFAVDLKARIASYVI